MKKEIWKEVKGYEGLYEISNYGRCRRIAYPIDTQAKEAQFGLPHYLKPNHGEWGHTRYALTHKGKVKLALAHRLVLEAFEVPNPHDKPHVNHIDNNPKNNYIENLEWCTHTENMQHMIKSGRKVTYRGKDHVESKTVHQFDKDMNFIAEYGSSGEASRKTGFLSGHIREACRGTLKTYKGYIWKYV